MDRQTGEGITGRWEAWLLERNRRGTTTLLWIVGFLYPIFGVLDYLIAPPGSLWLLYPTRALVTLITIVMFPVVLGRMFDRHPYLLSSGYMLVVSSGISLMTVRMGGLGSSYYAGLSLTIVATGLLFVWPRRVVVITHSAIVLSFVVPNLLLGSSLREMTAISNLFFLVSTAIIAGTGQFVAYRSQYEQVVNQVVIERTKANLEQAHAQLKQLDRFKSEFFANITHELKTPLTMVLAPLELMIQGELGLLTETQRVTLRSMLKSGIKLLRLIGDLLDLSKLDESRLRLNVGKHDLVAYMRGLVAQVRPLALRKNIGIEFEGNVEESLVWCDIERMERVFINLLSNAMKFTAPNTRVTVTLDDAENAVRVIVSDDGAGFPAGMSERLFERFFQVDMAGTRKFGGTGIGLALAKELVELHGGTIAAQNGANGGAVFTVRLIKDREHFGPDVLDRRGRREDRQGGSREGDRGVGDWQVETAEQFRLLAIEEATEQRIVDRDLDEDARPDSILVVEDTADIIRVIHLALRGQFRVFAAPGGAKGFELAVKHLPSLIITDLMMPEIDGFELTRMLRADARTKHIPIVMLTARSDLEDRVLGLESGVNAYLTKPFSTKELVSTVRSFVKIQEAAADALLAKKMDSLETIAGGLAHEINNPLNYVKNALFAVRRDCGTLEQVVRGPNAEPMGADDAAKVTVLMNRMGKMFDTAESGVKRIAATVALMHRYSREGYSRVMQGYDLFEAVQDAARLVGAATGGAVKLEVDTSGDGTVQCIPEEINQVFTNLIQNAIEASPQDGTGHVRVKGRGEGDAVVMTVRDNGSGIKPQDKERIFTPFFTTKEVGAGMGMGLSIAHRVIAALGGTISVWSEVGVGTEFRVRLPREPRVAPGVDSSGRGGVSATLDA